MTLTVLGFKGILMGIFQDVVRCFKEVKVGEI